MPKKLLAQKIFFFYSYLRNDILTIVHKCQSTLNAFIAHLFINVSIYTTYCCDGCGSGNGAASSLLTYSIHASHIKLCVCVRVYTICYYNNKYTRIHFLLSMFWSIYIYPHLWNVKTYLFIISIFFCVFSPWNHKQNHWFTVQ